MKESAFESRKEEHLDGKKDESEVKKQKLIVRPSPPLKPFISPLIHCLTFLLGPGFTGSARSQDGTKSGRAADRSRLLRAAYPLPLCPDPEMERRFSRRLF